MTDNKLTDEQIIKAWEKCANPANECCGDDYTCEYCKYDKGTGECFKQLRKDVTDLINRQKAEKEALINGQETLQKHIAEIKAEVERLQNAYKQCAWERDTFLEELKTAKSEARKELVERLKEKAKYFYCKKDNGFYEECSLIETDIVDNLLKEME